MNTTFEPIDVAELDDEQRRWLPDPIPSTVQVTRCTGCGDLRADVIPGNLKATWADHDKGCPGPPLTEAIASALLASGHFVAATADEPREDVITVQTATGLRFTLTLGIDSPAGADTDSGH